MKTKWNWGTKLVVWIIVFVLFILTLVFLSLGYDVNLVEKDYYPKGLKYQTRIDAIENANKLGVRFLIDQSEDDLYINIPDIQLDSGLITFFRPSDGSFDRAYKFSNSQQFRIPLSDFTNGKYILKINWWNDNKEYYIEQITNIKQ